MISVVACASASSSIEIEKEEQQQQHADNDVDDSEDDHNNNNVFRSPLPDIPISNHLPLHSYCFHRLPLFSHRPCLISSSSARTFSFADTLLASRQAAAALSALGVSKGDVFMILLPNSEHFVFCFLAASFLGAVVTPANPFFTPAEISKQLSASNARLVVTHSHCIPKLLHLDIPGLKIITVDHHDHATTNGNVDILPFSALLSTSSSKELPEVDIHPDDAVALPFSSGTTGLPKGVVLTHRSIITSVAQQVDGDNPNLHLTPHDVFLCVLPLFHIFALNSVLLCSLRAGAAVLLMPKFHMDDMLSLIQRHRVSVAAVVPPLVLALAKNPAVADYDLSSIRLVLSGAAPLGKDLLQALQSRVPQAIIGQGYGMTEAGPVVSMCLSFAKQPTAAVAGCCGTVVRNAELIVVEGETGRRLGRNEAGEICVRGDQIMKGYLNNEEATKATIDSRGFLHTGDIGYVDQHDQLFIVDRLKELIKFKGFQVAPAEIEALLLTHPGIADAAAVPQHDEVAGEVPVAFVVRSNSCECDEVTEESLKEFIAKQVVFYKKVHHVYFVESIPKSPSGKILRKNLRAKLLAL